MFGVLFVMAVLLSLALLELVSRRVRKHPGHRNPYLVSRHAASTYNHHNSFHQEPILHAEASHAEPANESMADLSQEEEQESESKNSKPLMQDMMKDLLVISVMAKPGEQFASYDLLQAITSAGLQFGDMNLFHYYSYIDPTNAPLFSLASATEPGEFNMDRIGDFTCIGLSLFTNLRDQNDPLFAYEVMLKTAEQLADDLHGLMCAGQKTPWSAEMEERYKQKVLRYQAHKYA